MTPGRLGRGEILYWLECRDRSELEKLWRQADECRRRWTGDRVWLRGLVEISNHCRRRCAYCGLNAANRRLKRYRMSDEEILASARQARRLGCDTVVLQSGEDLGFGHERIARLIGEIKNSTGLTVTLSLGERRLDELAAWRRAGADRYFLRFETSDRELFSRLRPPVRKSFSDRIELLRKLKHIGYEVGSGVMVGLPGQTLQSLADDLELLRELDLDMIGLGPYIPHPHTALAVEFGAGRSRRQNAEIELLTYKMMALARLLCPQANIPSTTALATVASGRGRRLGLQRGANVVMPNFTPAACRRLYEIYPGKGGGLESPGRSLGRLQLLVSSLGRRTGNG